MKSPLRSPLTGLLTLAGALAALAALAEADGGLRFLKPLMPTVEEQRKLRQEARANPDPARRLPHPPAGLRLNRNGRPVSAATATKTKTSILFKTVDAKAEREPQPDFAGRVDVAPENGDLKITNGKKAVLGQFPWQAGVLMDLGLFVGKAWCGGSIVHSLWILTAGHCVDDQPLSYTVSVGSLGSETGSEPSRQVFSGLTETYQHPAYNPYYIDNDIGLIKLNAHIQFNAYVRPVRLPSYSMATDMMAGTTGTVSGWGKTHDSDTWITSDLMYTENTIDDGTSCYDTYGNAWIPNKICVPTPDVHSICSGDSGGALTIVEEDGAHTQIGIVSFGASAGCEEKYPTAYTRLASFLDFVEEVTNIAVRD